MFMQIYTGPLAGVDINAALTGIDLKKIRSAELVEAATAFNGSIRRAAKLIEIPAKSNLTAQNNRETHEALAAASISHLWTAFECLCTDLWIETVNGHPRQLAQKITKATSDKNQPGKQISIERIAKYGFEIKRVMGEILADRFDLGNLEQAKTAYSETFDIPELKSIFENETLRRLQATRNCFVHNAGVIDEKYRKVCKDTNSGSNISLVPKTMTDFTTCVFKSGESLIQLIDDWIQKQRPKFGSINLCISITNGNSEPRLKAGSDVRVAVINSSNEEPPSVQIMTPDYVTLVSGTATLEIKPNSVVLFNDQQYHLLELKTFESRRAVDAWCAFHRAQR